MKEILKYLSAKYFFADYAPGVKRFNHKMRGKDSNGKEIDFTENDKKAIITGLKKMVKDISAKIK